MDDICEIKQRLIRSLEFKHICTNAIISTLLVIVFVLLLGPHRGDWTPSLNEGGLILLLSWVFTAGRSSRSSERRRNTSFASVRSVISISADPFSDGPASTLISRFCWTTRSMENSWSIPTLSSAPTVC